MQIRRVIADNFLDGISLFDTFGRRFPDVLDINYGKKGLIFGYWFKPMVYSYPSPVLKARRMKLIVQNYQCKDGDYQAQYRENYGGDCAFFYPPKRTVLIFLFACICGLVIGLYLINKSGYLILEAPKWLANLLAYSGYATCFCLSGPSLGCFGGLSPATA